MLKLTFFSHYFFAKVTSCKCWIDARIGLWVWCQLYPVFLRKYKLQYELFWKHQKRSACILNFTVFLSSDKEICSHHLFNTKRKRCLNTKLLFIFKASFYVILMRVVKHDHKLNYLLRVLLSIRKNRFEKFLSFPAILWSSWMEEITG